MRSCISIWAKGLGKLLLFLLLLIPFVPGWFLYYILRDTSCITYGVTAVIIFQTIVTLTRLLLGRGAKSVRSFVTDWARGLGKLLLFLLLLISFVPIWCGFYFGGYVACLTYGVKAVVIFQIVFTLTHILLSLVLARSGYAIVTGWWQGIRHSREMRAGCGLLCLVVVYVSMMVVAVWARMYNTIEVILPEQPEARALVLSVVKAQRELYEPKEYALGWYPRFQLASPSVNAVRSVLYRSGNMEETLVNALSASGFVITVVSDFSEKWLVRSCQDVDEQNRRKHDERRSE